MADRASAMRRFAVRCSPRQAGRPSSSTRRQGSLAHPADRFVGDLGGSLGRSPRALKHRLDIVADDLRLDREQFLNAAAFQQPIEVIEILFRAALGKSYPFAGNVLKST